MKQAHALSLLQAAQKKKKLKKMLNYVLYISDTSFQKYEQVALRSSREKIHYSTNIETPYIFQSKSSVLSVCFMVDFAKKEEILEYYLQHTACAGPRISNVKRKVVLKQVTKKKK